MRAAAACTDLISLSKYLGLAPQHLFYLIALSDELYTEIKIPKKTKRRRYRKIHIPNLELKGAQRSILKEILSQIEVSRYAHAYVKGKSIVGAAQALAGRQSVLKFDIKDFFPSISSSRVYGLFRALRFNERVSWMLMRLCTYDDSLCQGAPTSPYISNLICRRLDRNLFDLQTHGGFHTCATATIFTFMALRIFDIKCSRTMCALLLEKMVFNLTLVRQDIIPLVSHVLHLVLQLTTRSQGCPGIRSENTGRRSFGHLVI